MFEVNVLALMTCTREAVKRMGTKEGCVVNISSMSGHRLTSTPTNVYCATKFAVKALTEATRRELRAKVCAVLCVCVAAYPHLCVFVWLRTRICVCLWLWLYAMYSRVHVCRHPLCARCTQLNSCVRHV